jgi:hypothetical protein
MQEQHKTRFGVTLAAVLIVCAFVAVALLAVLGTGENGVHTLAVVILGIVLALVGAGLSAALNMIKSTPSKAGQRHSAHQRVGVGLIAALLGLALASMIVVAINDGSKELSKSAMEALFVLAGVGIAAVLTMLRTEAARQESEAGTERAAEALAEARSAREHAETARAEAAADRDEQARRDAETRRIVADPKARRAERKAAKP